MNGEELLVLTISPRRDPPPPSMLLPLTITALALFDAPWCDRRRVVCATGIALFCRPALAVAATDPGAAAAGRLQSGLLVLEDVVGRWKEVTTDCRYGEIRRELLSSESKEELLKAASSTSKGDTMVVLCKSTGRLVREAIGADASPLNNIAKLLERPALVQRVEFDQIDAFQAASEKLQQSLAAADAAAYFAATADFSAQTAFKRGEAPLTPNLDAARQAIVDARDAMKVVITLTS